MAFSQYPEANEEVADGLSATQPMVEQGNNDAEHSALQMGDITTFDFDIYKYKRPNNYFQSSKEESMVKEYLKNE